MFFKQLDQIPHIAAHTSCAIFVIDPATNLNLPHALSLTPDPAKKTSTITVESMREFLTHTQNSETQDRFFIIKPADAMNEASANAFLKTFEEPKPFCHFVLLTTSPNSLLPTILSRAQVFYHKKPHQLDQPPIAQPKTIAQAKKLIAATTNQLPSLAVELTKSKTNTREQILSAIQVAIELLYKSYFKTKNPKFLLKLRDFIQLYDSISNNGHLKLHLVADLC